MAQKIAGREPPRTGGTEDARLVTPSLCHSQADRHFRDRVRRLHTRGPRAVGEVLAEIIGRYPRTRLFVEERLDRFADLDPALVAHFGGRDWIEPAAVLRLVVGGRA
jgi:hypothetical protein